MKEPKTEILKFNRHYRYVCPNCLRTFLDTKYSEDEFCWKCGQKLDVIPKDVLFD